MEFLISLDRLYWNAKIWVQLFVFTIDNSSVLKSSQKNIKRMVNITVRPYLHGNTIIIPIINLNTLFTQPGVFRHKVRRVFIIWIRNRSLRFEIHSFCSKCRSVHLAKGKFTRITLNQVSYSACDNISILCWNLISKCRKVLALIFEFIPD